jgi:hypothetical protein
VPPPEALGDLPADPLGEGGSETVASLDEGGP